MNTAKASQILVFVGKKQKNSLQNWQNLLKKGEVLNKSFKFDREVAESVGLESAIILDWIKSKEETIKLIDAFKAFSFWNETDLMSYLVSLEQKNLIGLNLDKKIISKTVSAKKKNSVQMKKIHNKSQKIRRASCRERV